MVRGLRRRVMGSMCSALGATERQSCASQKLGRNPPSGLDVELFVGDGEVPLPPLFFRWQPW